MKLQSPIRRFTTPAGAAAPLPALAERQLVHPVPREVVPDVAEADALPFV